MGIFDAATEGFKGWWSGGVDGAKTGLKWGAIIGAILGFLLGGFSIVGALEGAAIGGSIGAVGGGLVGSQAKGWWSAIKGLFGFGKDDGQQSQEGSRSRSEEQAFDYNSLTANVPPGMGKGQQR